jgi:hypothetical protein
MEPMEFYINFDEQPEEKLDLIAYAFTGAGELLDAQPIREGRFQFKLEASQLKRARVLIAPRQEKGREQPTLDELVHMHAYEPAIPMRGAQGRLELLPIPKLVWQWWLRCICRVRGQVVRPVTINGITYQKPVCHARVHICEVDKWYWLIQRLPEQDILRLRDDLLKWAEVRIPRIPMPDPPPDFHFDPGVIDPSPIQLARLNRATLAGFDPQPDPPAPFSIRLRNAADMVALNPQPEPPGIAGSHLHGIGGEVALNPQPLPPGGDVLMFNPQPDPPRLLPGELRLALASDSATTLRAALAEHVLTIYPIFCHFHWLHYWFHCDELAVVYTDAFGRFDRLISYPCFGDKPDLYFWVEYCIGGVWTTVYRPSIACHTYWNYHCGSQVTIQVNDPRVPWCDDPSPLTGMQLAVLSIGNEVSTSEIQLSGSASYGLTSTGQPFGGSLEPHVWFGSGLIPAGVTHYRWSYRRLGSSGDWAALDRQVVRHYAEIAPDDTLTFKPFVLGPDTAFPSDTRYKIQPVDSPGDSWAPMVDARENTASGFFLSHLLEAGDAVAGAGKYELKLELIDAAGNIVNLTDAGILVKEATVPAAFGLGSVPTAVPPDERLIKNAAGDVVAYRIVLHIDNNPCQGEILPVLGTGVTIDADCGFYEYGPGATVRIRFRASHPNGFATFNFDTVRGLSNAVEAASASGSVTAAAVNGFVRFGTIFSKAGIPVIGAEGTSMLEASGCDRAAFALTLHVDALATDGWSTLTYLDANPPAVAIALVPVP